MQLMDAAEEILLFSLNNQMALTEIDKVSVELESDDTSFGGLEQCAIFCKVQIHHTAAWQLVRLAKLAQMLRNPIGRSSP